MTFFKNQFSNKIQKVLEKKITCGFIRKKCSSMLFTEKYYLEEWKNYKPFKIQNRPKNHQKMIIFWDLFFQIF